MKKTLLLLLLAAGSFCRAQTLTIQEFATGFGDPVEIVNAGDTRLFVVDQQGFIKIVNAGGTVNAANFLTITPLISTGGERGLLGLAFHPEYATNGYFYINYTNAIGSTVVARYQRSTTNPDLADATTATILLTIAQPASNHNGGTLHFGPDGYLYIGMGDGGGAGDTNNRAQNIELLLGKMLRIDVNGALPYTIPPTNAFVGVAGADEIWSVGMRNPWKFSFNRLNGDLWIADVGQDAIEEINKVPAGTAAGLNFGWRCYEGNTIYNGAGCQAASAYTMPFTQYNQGIAGRCSITGGYLYTGSLYPNLQGKYVFADYCGNQMGYAKPDGTITWSAIFANNSFSTLGEGANGELYIAGRSSGKIFRIVDTSLSTESFAKGAFTVYPNPATNVINIKNPATGIYAAQARIYDLSGKLVSDVALNETETNAVAINNLTPGFYMMHITDSKGMQTGHKVTIQ